MFVTGIYVVSAYHNGPGHSSSPRLRPTQAFHLLPGGPSLGPATAYQLTGPLGVALDSVGNSYFTDANEVLRVDHTTQKISVVAGTARLAARGRIYWGDGGPAIKAGLFAPFGVAIAHNGDLYIAEGDNRVRRVSASTGIITTVAGDGLAGSAGDAGPATQAELDFRGGGFGSSSISLAPNGDLYIADGGSLRLRRVSATTGIITTVAGTGRRGPSGDGGPAIHAELDAPAGVTVDDHGNFFVASWTSIREISSETGVIRTVYGPLRGVVPTTAQPAYGLAFGPKGLLYFSTLYGREILSLNPATHDFSVVAGTGTETVQEPGAKAGDGGPASEATFGLAAGLAIDASGNIYVADFFNNSVRKIDSTTGVIGNVAGQIPQSPAHCC